MPEPVLLSVSQLRKSFAVPVLRDFDLTLCAGEVHALVGGNGAGKSTLARIICGLLVADSGQMQWAGQTHAPKSRRDAQAAGITLMLQELNVLPTLSLAENLFLHDLPSRWGMVNRPLLRQKAERALERVGLQHMSPDTLAGTLGIGHQQLVELAAALEEKCKLLILDEPTAALTSRETETLFAHIERLRSEGACILYVSHRMDELRRIADRVSVLRDGQRIATLPMKHTSAQELVKLMAGKEVSATPKPRTRSAGKVLLEVSRLKVPPAVREVSFTVQAGEILGLSGLVGAGRTETLRAIFGLERSTSGSIEIAGVKGQPRDSAAATAVGLALVPEDRKTQGLLLSQSIRVNTTLASLEGAVISPAKEKQQTEGILQRLAVKCDHTEQPVSALSGGNQQKLVIGKWLLRGVQIFLLDEPTRGVDVPAKEAIYDLLRQLADEGKAVVVVSSELPELMSLCDRIVVLSAGRTVGEFLPHEWTAEKLTEAAFRGHLSVH